VEKPDKDMFNPKDFLAKVGAGKRVGDVPIAVELRRADVAGMNVTRPS